MKTIKVKLLGSTTQPFTIHVNPGDTAGEVLTKLNLAHCILAIPPAPNRYFAPHDAVYEELLEGDFLLAVAKRSCTIDPEALSEFVEGEEDTPAITIDSDEAREDLRQLLEIDDEEPEDDDPAFLYRWIMPT
jgi:hypothetical protein